MPHTDTPANSLHDTTSGASHHISAMAAAPSPTVPTSFIYIFSSHQKGMQEHAFLSSVLFRDIATQCPSHRVIYRELSQFYPYINQQYWRQEADPTYEPNKMVFIWNNDRMFGAGTFKNQRQSEVMSWLQQPDHQPFAKKYLVHILQSDEQGNDDQNYWADTSYYKYLNSVYHTYIRNNIGQQMSYVLTDMQALFEQDSTHELHRVIDWSTMIEFVERHADTLNIDVSNGCPLHYTGPKRRDLPGWQKDHQSSKQSHAKLSPMWDGIMTDYEHADHEYHAWMSDLPTSVQPDSFNNTPVYWLPLGYANSYLQQAAQMQATPVTNRSLLFAWSGSNREDERPQLNKTLVELDAGKNILARGLFQFNDGFGKGLQYLPYTTLLTDSMVIPVPRGGSPEQYRIHEAIDAGAFLMVHQRWLHDPVQTATSYRALSFLTLLGMDPIDVTDFSADFVRRLNAVSCLPPQLLNRFQAVIQQRYQIIWSTMTRQIANNLCTPLIVS